MSGMKGTHVKPVFKCMLLLLLEILKPELDISSEDRNKIVLKKIKGSSFTGARFRVFVVGF